MMTAQQDDASCLATLTESCVADLRKRGLSLACAESLTGGLLTAQFVTVPGVSAVLRGGVVSYATDLKASILGVSSERLASHGPVDRDVALQMAQGVCAVTGADIGMATTGVAGPGPHDGHPAGTVWIAVSARGGAQVARELHIAGGRSDVRSGAVRGAVELLDAFLHDGATDQGAESAVS
ncbi:MULTISPECIES: CinA family protein [Actinomycetaceae]|uniref:Competence/damage-inducible protein CinA domain n=1 Tax=Actinotignum schaalii FB123-CNA-2 TaxID=883067 RepID=S2VLM5_9ACTO|nr:MULTISPECIES: nicotinamide-nucleotide amidohydrolase family protein [Actinotignum]EPD26960.1 competence/damage-inducible protein CinA domain [Actinotignum schaalii FB123-CNA-2]MDE1552581.1 nicotinamide-nucleotide amidohydrolase family protein [Actinotignum sanguinis]MDE1565318.1 nicotinamide-nucleotide amidohydrolase family protein [Actinotignum sanguinis]MDE1577162.1 nicotinamide-nucleotide amidohydrolase family protein [Actinotignum sanguinis]MDE1641713.1 nicotinamide-nucleotide amidohydr